MIDQIEVERVALFYKLGRVSEMEILFRHDNSF